MTSDSELEAVIERIRELDPSGERTAKVLRHTFDQLYDGLNTGRYRWDQLYKTEKTHCGTILEINLQREFRFDDGALMDYQIAGVEVDCKYSQSIGGWMIPPESLGHLCLLISADDQQATWNLGVVRIDEAILSRGGNRDSKRTITSAGGDRIRWVFESAALPPNVLLQLPRATVDRMMEIPNGQQRVDELFRVAQGLRITRVVIATLGRQDDYMKRVRGNGGSRSRLKPEGIIILGHYAMHSRIARQLGLPVPEQGEFVSARLARGSAKEDRVVELDEKFWRVARASDPVTTAPHYPHFTRT